MATDSTEPGITTLHPHFLRELGIIDGILLADTGRGIELHECSYSLRKCILHDDVRMALLTPSETVTHRPFQGDASYYTFGETKDVAWSCEQPLDEVGTIDRRLAFYQEMVE